MTVFAFYMSFESLIVVSNRFFSSTSWRAKKASEKRRFFLTKFPKDFDVGRDVVKSKDCEKGMSLLVLFASSKSLDSFKTPSLLEARGCKIRITIGTAQIFKFGAI